MSLIVVNGDNLELLKSYPDNYFDSVVTDPPYGLGKEPNASELMKDWIEHGYHKIQGSGFMGKEWDAFVPQPLFWKEVFRVLKHGGHVVAFYGTRTYDWGVMAMRFAGFEVRDCIQWIYGSGFPKSYNISKGIDKKPNILLADNFRDKLNEFRLKSNLSIKQINKHFGFAINGSGVAHHWFLHKTQPTIPTYEQYKELKILLQINDEFDNIYYEAERELLYINKNGSGSGTIVTDSGNLKKEFAVTAPSTDAAKKWEGWGSALKPANEPIVLARKPLEKGLSIAENTLKWGVGGINIDATRVGTNRPETNSDSNKFNNWKEQDGNKRNNSNTPDLDTNKGRFPANVILTHHPECECKGLKKIKAIKGGCKFESAFFKSGESNFTKDGGIGDENGEETVEDWNCHPDCPIKIMDEQSGQSKSKSFIAPMRDIRGNGDNLYTSASGNERKVRDIITTNGHNDSGGASRFFYCAKASKSERNKGLEGFEDKQSIGGGGGIGDYLDDVNSASGKYKSEKAPNKNFHPTVKPVKLMQYLVKLVTPANGIVLDPFCGSGTTGIACKLEGFQFVGIEQDSEYTKIADARIKNTEINKQQLLF